MMRRFTDLFRLFVNAQIQSIDDVENRFDDLIVQRYQHVLSIENRISRRVEFLQSATILEETERA